MRLQFMSRFRHDIREEAPESPLLLHSHLFSHGVRANPLTISQATFEKQ